MEQHSDTMQNEYKQHQMNMGNQVHQDMPDTVPPVLGAQGGHPAEMNQHLSPEEIARATEHDEPETSPEQVRKEVVV